MGTYYVDGASGNDSNVGSTGSPWKTLAKARNTASSGDVIKVRTATYYEKLDIPQGVTFEADTGHTPTIDGRYSAALFGAAGYTSSDGKPLTPDTLPGPTAANASKGNFVVYGDYAPIVILAAAGAKIKNFVIRNVCGRAITVTGNNTVVEGCRIDFTYQTGITIDSGSNILIKNNVITRCSQKKFDPGQKGHVATTLIVKSIDTIIDGNLIAYNWGEGISADKGAARLTIRNNTIHTNNHWPLGINSAQQATFYNNTTYVCENLYDVFGGNISASFILGDEKGAVDFPNSTQTLVWNNLFIGGNTTLLSSGGVNQKETRVFTWDRGYFGYNTVVSMAHTAGSTVLLQRHQAKPNTNSVWENNIFLAHPDQTGGFIKTDVSVSDNGILFRNNLGNRPLPGPFANNGIVSSGAAGLWNPFARITGVFDNKSTALPDPSNTTFDPANYDLTAGSPAVGRAAARPATLNGLTMPSINKDRYGAGRTDFNAASGRYYDIGSDEYDAGSPPPENDTLTAGFNRTPASGNAPLTVNYTDTSQVTGAAAITNWLWQFGDGTTSTAQNPTKVYTAAGTYTTTLTVTDSVNSLTSTYIGGTVTVSVVATGSVSARFTRTPSAGEAGVTSFTFTDTSTETGNGNIDTWLWDFGDGATSALQNPTHTYTAAGTYRPRLTVFDSVRGYTSSWAGPDTAVGTAPADPQIEAAFTQSAVMGQAPLTVTFTDTSLETGGANIDGWYWDFGDGLTSTSASPSHVYAAGGNYSPRLTVTDSTNGLVSSFLGDTISVTAPPPPGAGGDVVLRQTRAALNTASGNQTFTAAGLGGLTPSSARFIVTAATADGTAADGERFCYGATTGGAQWAACIASQHGVADVNAARMWSDDACILLIDGNGAEMLRATFVAWTADGVTLDLDWAIGGTAYLVTVIFGAGTEYEAWVGTASMGANNSTTNVSVGFAADLVRGVATWGVHESAAADATLSLGFAHRLGGQYVVERYYADALADGENRMRLFEGEFMHYRYNTAARAGVFVSSWSTSGMTLKVKDGAINSTALLMAEKFGDVGSRVALVDSAITTGNTDYALDWNPQYVEHLLSQATGLGSINDNAKAGTIGVHTVTPAGEFSNEVSGENGAATTNEQSLSDDQFIVVGHTGTTVAAGTTTLGTAMYSINYATAPGTALKLPSLAVEEGAAVVVPGDYVTAEFAASVTSGATPLTVRFTDLSSGTYPVTEWAWDFGDGSTSTEQNPTHVYRASGVFTVSLTASDGRTVPATGTETKSDYITVLGAAKREIIVGPYQMRPITEATTSTTYRDPADEANGGYMEVGLALNGLRLNADPEVPGALSGEWVLYIDAASGDLKVKRSDSTTGTVDIT